MKLISLNVWGGQLEEQLKQFIIDHQDVDVFCLQEVYHQADDKVYDEDRWVSLDIFGEIARLLPGHRGFFRPVVGSIYGIAAFVREDIQVIDENEFLIYDNPGWEGKGPTHSRILQSIHCKDSVREYCILNLHGLWNGCGKEDTPDRIQQSKNIRHVMDRFDVPIVVCGDFNLKPQTESLAIVAESMENLIHSYNVQSTRTSWYPKPEKFADYVFTSPDIHVKDFRILPHEVSDHAPLYLEFV